MRGLFLPENAVIDIHCHILPALDDGPRTLEESIAMLEEAAAAGTTDIVATPHADLRFPHDPEIAARKTAELAAAAPVGIRLHRGCELHLSFDNVQAALADPGRFVLGPGPYLLVELPETFLPAAVAGVLSELRRVGLVPVIAHPERNAELRHLRKHLDEWIAAGCLVQITAQSLAGRFGGQARKFSRDLLAGDAVHFVATDAHGRDDRPPRLDEAYREIARTFSERRAERLIVDNPRALLEGAALPAAEEAEPRRKWYRFGT